LIVADTNLIAYLLIEGERTGVAHEVYRMDPDWRAPTLWRVEFRNILTMSVRTGRMQPETAMATWREAALLIRDEPVIETRSLQLALDRGLTAYDAEFAALAEALEVPLVTADRKLLSESDRAVSPETFSA